MNRNKALISVIILAVVLLAVSFIIRSCRKAPETDAKQQPERDTVALFSTQSNDEPEIIEENTPSGTIAPSESIITKENVNKKNCILVVSKTDYKLYVREITGKDTTTVASFPVCYAKNKEQKTRNGDFCTPECDQEHPFHISEIKDASTWCHDFKDGRGEILAYGHWFMRLDLSQSFPDNPEVANNRSIGIHGSTNNELSVPGNASEGCVRLRDEDLEILHDRYAYVGQTVIIEPYKQSKK